MMGKAIDLRGKKIGRLTVIEKVDNPKKNGVLWKCLCECGNEKFVLSGMLNSGNTRSCGCLAKDAKTWKRGAIKDKQSGKRITEIHDSMVKRCYNNNCKQYRNYGGRGIAVCDEWHLRGGLRRFYEWAMNNGYDDSLSIDRIDVNGNYCPENCRWATPKVQANNTRRNVFIEYNGERHTITEWAEFSEVTRKAIEYRIKNGWKVEDALFAPKMSNGGRKKKC